MSNGEDQMDVVAGHGSDEEDGEWRPCGPPDEPVEFCALCLLRSADQSSAIPASVLAVLRNMESTAARTPDTAISQKKVLLQKMYDASIKEYVEGKPEWTFVSIKNHLTGVHPTSSIRRLQEIAAQPIGPLLTALMDHSFFINRKGNRRPNLKVIGAYTKLTQLVFSIRT